MENESRIQRKPLLEIQTTDMSRSEDIADSTEGNTGDETQGCDKNITST